MPVGVGGRQAAPIPKAAQAGAKPAAAPTAPPAGSKGGGMKKILMVLVILLVVLALTGGTLLTLKMLGLLGGESERGGTQSQMPMPTTTALAVGKIAVSTGEGMNINLAEGHFLAFSATVYFDESVEEAVEDSAPARDAAYRLFKGMKVEDFDKSSSQKELQEKYLKLLNEETIPPWNGHVAAVRFDMFTHD